jgi:hypothetical protein
VRVCTLWKSLLLVPTQKSALPETPPSYSQLRETGRESLKNSVASEFWVLISKTQDFPLQDSVGFVWKVEV